MRLVFMGPPGVGKGTQATLIKTHYKIVHLSTGDILRGEIDSKTQLGRNAKKFMIEGKLVPDDLLLEMMNIRLHQPDCENGYLLDGFPRTLPQAEGLDAILLELNQTLDYAINITADNKELVRRLIIRGKSRVEMTIHLLSSERDNRSTGIKRHLLLNIMKKKVYWLK